MVGAAPVSGCDEPDLDDMIEVSAHDFVKRNGEISCLRCFQSQKVGKGKKLADSITFVRSECSPVCKSQFMRPVFPWFRLCLS